MTNKNHTDRIATLEAQLAEAQNQLDSALHSVDVLERRTADALAALNRIREEVRREGWEAAKREAKMVAHDWTPDRPLNARSTGLSIKAGIAALTYQKGDSHE